MSPALPYRWGEPSLAASPHLSLCSVSACRTWTLPWLALPYLTLRIPIPDAPSPVCLRSLCLRGFVSWPVSVVCHRCTALHRVKLVPSQSPAAALKPERSPLIRPNHPSPPRRPRLIHQPANRAPGTLRPAPSDRHPPPRQANLHPLQFSPKRLPKPSSKRPRCSHSSLRPRNITAHLLFLSISSSAPRCHRNGSARSSIVEGTFLPS